MTAAQHLRRKPSASVSQVLCGVVHWLDSLHRSNMPASAPTGRRSTPNLSSYAVRSEAKTFREKVTGAHSDRRELPKTLHALAPGDVVTRIDRLARSAFDLFAIVKQIVDAKAQFRSLAEPWADTGTSTGRLMIAVLGGLADVER